MPLNIFSYINNKALKILKHAYIASFKNYNTSIFSTRFVNNYVSFPITDLFYFLVYKLTSLSSDMYKKNLFCVGPLFLVLVNDAREKCDERRGDGKSIVKKLLTVLLLDSTLHCVKSVQIRTRKTLFIQ